MTPELQTSYVAFDIRYPPFNDRRVRRAFAMTIDQGKLTNVALRLSGSPAMGGYIPPGILGHSPDIGLPFDPEQARRLLAEAGYPGGSGFPTIETAVYKGRQRTVEFLSAQWRECLGVEITWEYMDFAASSEKKRQGSYQINWGGWIADYPDPDNFLRTSQLQQRTYWHNDAFDSLVEDAKRISDHQERMKFYRKADHMLVEEAVIVPLIYGQSHWLVKPWVRNFVVRKFLEVIWKDNIIDPH